jgi:hypothetical protein
MVAAAAAAGAAPLDGVLSRRRVAANSVGTKHLAPPPLRCGTQLTQGLGSGESAILQLVCDTGALGSIAVSCAGAAQLLDPCCHVRCTAGARSTFLMRRKLSHHSLRVEEVFLRECLLAVRREGTRRRGSPRHVGVVTASCERSVPHWCGAESLESILGLDGFRACEGAVSRCR